MTMTLETLSADIEVMTGLAQSMLDQLTEMEAAIREAQAEIRAAG